MGNMMNMMQAQAMWAYGCGKPIVGGCPAPSTAPSTGANGSTKTKPGDWICQDCQNVNFSNRNSCNRCGGSRRGTTRLGMKPGDWICPNCGDLVFASRSQCKMCDTAKPEIESAVARPSSRFAPY